jgi:hypothetical protein
MSALCRTLFGDAQNATIVAALIAVAVALVLTGHQGQAGYVLPPLVLVGVGWLAAR